MRIKLFLESTQNQHCFNVKFWRWFNVDKLTFFWRWNMVIFSTLILRFYFFKHHNVKTNLFLESTQNQSSNKSTFNQRRYHVDRRRDVISTYINVESMLNVCWVLVNRKMRCNNNSFSVCFIWNVVFPNIFCFIYKTVYF